MRPVLLAVFVSSLLAGVLLWSARDPRGGQGPAGASLSPVSALSGPEAEGFARAEAPRDFRFPEDHGPHPDFRTEWWYLTGHLEGPEGEEFGFQVTFFRNAVHPEEPAGTSEWATNQVYMAHFALTDVASGRHRAFERSARGAAGLAGARGRPFRVHVEDWTMESEAEGELFPLRVRAAAGGEELRLEVAPGKPLVLQGDRGLSAKGGEPGNASYYYSFTRLPVSGEVRREGEWVAVRGTAWLDREWSTSALEPAHEGWDWFSLQLDDGRELMVYELRRSDGAPDPFDSGVLVDPDGSYRVLRGEEVELDVADSWESPLDGAVYPSGWRLRIPGEGIDLEIDPAVRDQEMDLTFRYWEGLVEVDGTGPDGPVEGRGYVELTGYAGEGARPEP